MRSPSLTDIDAIRRRGFRPVVVACFLCAGKLLFVFKKEHELWLLPQGGVENGETIETALAREMMEELGSAFANRADIPVFIGEDALTFPTKNQGSRDLKTDAGTAVHMIGKHYFFLGITVHRTELTLADTEFQDARWVTRLEGKNMAETIYQVGRRRITEHALELLQQANLIS